MLIYIKITDRLKKQMKGNNFEKVIKLDKGDIRIVQCLHFFNSFINECDHIFTLYCVCMCRMI